MNGKTYTIGEYGAFITGKSAEGYITLPKKTFDALEEFILSGRGADSSVEIMELSVKKGVGKAISAKNYVGVIKMKDGTSVEILPKLYSPQYKNKEQIKGLFVKMLRTLGKLQNYKKMEHAEIDTDKINIFEVFISEFTDEAFKIVKYGLKHSYNGIRSNESVLKGKLIFSEHIKRNYAHKEKCFAEYDVFSFDCPENRLIKSTLLYLYTLTEKAKTKRDIRVLLGCFDEVKGSENYDRDFSSIVYDRTNKSYGLALSLSRVFLKGESFTAFKGSQISAALLFPMEQVFESYVSHWIRRIFANTEFKVSLQDKRYYLCNKPHNRFALIPDIVLDNNKEIYIFDTKWKIISPDRKKDGIAQEDMYQMYAYQKKYGAKSVTLIYPLSEKTGDNRELCFSAEDGFRLRALFVDLFDISSSLEVLKAELTADVSLQ